MSASARPFAGCAVAMTPSHARLRASEHLDLPANLEVATDLFDELELAALSVANGNSEDIKVMVELSPRAVKAFEALTSSLTSGNSCEGNSSLSPEEWIQRHEQISKLAGPSQEIPAERLALRTTTS